MPIALRLEDVLDQLQSPREQERERAARRLARLGRVGLTPEQGLLALKASTLPYPARRFPGDDTTIDLIRAALQVPFPEYLPQIVQRFPLWHERARGEVMSLIARIDDKRAAEAYVEILRRHAMPGLVPRMPLGMYSSAPQYPEIFFPELLNFLELPKLRVAVYEFCLSFASAQLIDTDILMPFKDQFLSAYRKRRDVLRPAQCADGVAWRWKARYHRRRWQAGVLLDLLGYVPDADVERELRRAADEYADPRLAMYAMLSLLRLNHDVEPASIQRVAECPEARKWLFDSLQKLERFHLYPSQFRNQSALAESDLVNWLVHPHELGRAPDEMEFVQTIPFDSGTEDGWLDYYLFRFRSSSPGWAARRGWMAGISGPFLRRESPTVQALGDTHSQFVPWEQKTLDEHVEDVYELMKTWRERHVAE